MIRNIKQLLRESRYLKNIYKTNFNKKVLISYTVSAFLTNKNTHTNISESRVIANIFKDLGFNIDIIDYTNQRKIEYKTYNLIFGFGEPFENSFVDKNLKRIYYATGAHVCHQNYAELKRIEEVNTKYNSTILPKRLIPWNWSLSTSLSDSLIVIGNNWTKSTYVKYTKKQVFTICATALINDNSQKIVRNIKKTKKSFLWFGSSGLVHKGLDLCLEYFSKNKDLTLHICGPMENDFKEIFGSYLEKENIYYHSFIDVRSQKFIDITSQCNFGILPTCSEGQATSLLTIMGAGLIPIATKYSGIDIENLGFLIDELDLDSIDKVVQKVIASEDKEIENNSKKNINYIQENHTLEVFENCLKLLIEKIINV